MQNGVRLWGWVSLPVALGVLGYHPYAEDGGLYVAEIKHRLHPDLYHAGTEFVTGHLGASLFPPAIAFVAGATHLHLDWILLLIQAVSVAGLLFGVWRIAVQCYPAAQARAGVLLLVALAMGMPVAGTSLMLMDPYVTARTITTALTVVALALVVERRWGWALGALALAVLVHPLMGSIAAAAAALLGCLLDRRPRIQIGGSVVVALLAVLAACTIHALAGQEPAEYQRVVSTRYYWFLGEWHWFEWLGLFGPLAILGWAGWRARGTERVLARMGLILGGIAAGISAGFAREADPVHAVARLQPLRCFLVVYVVLLILLGAWAGEKVLRRSMWRWTLAALALGGSMLAVQRQTYPASDHLELPGVPTRNAWAQAFLWVRANTPQDALFAVDADYVHRPGEDAQGFRAIAERSVLPDYSKDGGQASIRPELTVAWAFGQHVQAQLTRETDVERLAALRGTGVSWVVLGDEAITAWPCPYRNPVVVVCRVPDLY